MITVACVLRSGGIYDASWVAKLRAGVATHLVGPHKFLCMTDLHVRGSMTPFLHNWPGWWAKFELFRLYGTVLFFDLDTLIVGDLSEAVAEARKTKRLIMLTNFYNKSGFGSGVMAWNESCRVFDIYRKFRDTSDHHMQSHNGDQECIEAIAGKDNIARWQDLLPGQFVSYKADKCERKVPEGARVVCLHGKPKFSDMPANSIVRKTWEQAA